MGQEPVSDILIAGGSHVGLTLALSLDRLLGTDVRITVVERQALETSAATPPDPRAFAIAAASKHLLDAVGVWSQVAARAQPVEAIDVTDSDLDHAVRPIVLSYDNATATGEPATWIVPATALAVALRTVAQQRPNITLVGDEIGRVDIGPARARVALASGRSLAGRLLVAADGRHSVVRDAVGIDTVGWSWGQVGIVANVRHERPHRARAVQHFLPGGPFAILPLVGDRSCITWSETSDEGRRIVALDDAGFAAEAERRFGHRLGALMLEGPRALWPLEHHMARALVARRVALVGDAARSVHPIAGQGLNLGLRDAAALAESVADTMRVGLDAGDATGLERYELWRRFDATMAAAAFGALNTLFSNESMVLRVARGAGLSVVDRLPGLKQAFVAEAAGLTGTIPLLMQGHGPLGT